MKLLHLVSLREVGGIQRDFANFVSTSPAGRAVEHHLLLTRPGIAEAIAPQVRSSVASIRALRHWGTLEIPAGLPMVRQWWFQRAVKRSQADAIVLWSAPRALQHIDVPPATRLIYYEHGAAWFNRDTDEVARQVKRADGIVCNSNASARMMRLRWGVGAAQPVVVCPNAVVMPTGASAAAPRSLPPGARLTLGMAGRLESLKGGVLALHALRALLDHGVDARLLVAGTGPDRARLEQQAAALEISERVEFLGFVDQMQSFYARLDVFLCPSIREPFGLVCAEAMAHGLPVVCSAVDGLPEVVLDGVTGVCVPPSLPLTDYGAYGGVADGVPGYVYDPASDAIRPARLVDPAGLANAVLAVTADEAGYARFSGAALERAGVLADYAGHVGDVLDAIRSFIDVPREAA
ncbi:glycosyltransferase [Nitrogeniibacter aestuarii]|uniref:glycosyltransferase n=1 Tax=Nitrogeniibacter aestuarii TaxID=2815343 RepID=UPI001E57B427|nr:glycosyltransferase [Nitrogeniibacter aestuarii]